MSLENISPAKKNKYDTLKIILDYLKEHKYISNYMETEGGYNLFLHDDLIKNSKEDEKVIETLSSLINERYLKIDKNIPVISYVYNKMNPDIKNNKKVKDIVRIEL